MVALLVVPLALQALAMAVDEGFFHRRRGLPRWERIGHPLDTLTVVVAILVLVTTEALVPYALLAFFSCLFVTKDEPVHARVCTVGERWLHAVLFVLHPMVFLSLALLWMRGHEGIVWAQLAATVAFGLWQLLYWRPAWR